MDNISGVGRRGYTNEELDALHQDQGTEKILNKARKDAGFRDPDVSTRGDDKSLDAQLHGHVAKGEAVAGGLHGAEIGLALAEHAGKSLVALSLDIGLPLVAWGAGQYGMYEMENQKGEIKDAAARDQMNAAMVDNLELPAGYSDQRIKELGVSFTNNSPADRIGTQLQNNDKPLLATLQLHCDQGMHAGRDLVESGQSKQAFLASHPDVAKRYASDMAFREGFDAMAWAHKQGPATYEGAMKSLDERDARNAQAHVAFRG